MSDILKSARINAAKNGSNESRAIKHNAGLEELFNRRQALIQAMNAAKLKAIEEATRPFRDQLLEIDQQYSMLLTMLGDNSEDDE